MLRLRCRVTSLNVAGKLSDRSFGDTVERLGLPVVKIQEQQLGADAVPRQVQVFPYPLLPRQLSRRPVCLSPPRHAPLPCSCRRRRRRNTRAPWQPRGCPFLPPSSAESRPPTEFARKCTRFLWLMSAPASRRYRRETTSLLRAA